MIEAIIVVVLSLMFLGAMFGLGLRRERRRLREAQDEVRRSGNPHPDGHDPWQYYDYFN
jgi:hypothetical protein